MRIRRITFIAVIAVVVFAAAAVNIHADQPEARFSPDRILKGTTPTIIITLDKSIQNQEEIKNIRLGGQVVDVKRSEGKLSVQLPKLDLVGLADVEVLGKDDKVVAVGQLKYVESTERIKGVWLLLLYVFLIVLPPSIFTFYDINRSYAERSKVLNKLDGCNATIDQIKALLADMDQGPTGLTGLTRGIVAVTLILVLAIAVFHLVVFPPGKVPDIAEKLLMLLAGTLTAITGFYFGSKAATEAASATKSGDGKTGGSVVPTVPTISQVDPTEGAKAGDKVTVTGKGFGKQQGKGIVKFDEQKGAVDKKEDWTDTSIKVAVPSGMSPTQVKIVVTNDDGKPSEPYPYNIIRQN
ncbi:MAG TPA: IPT/TIG domain-containing protein [Nitrospirota bacterium]|nr:IPT/TIG domain-containing protein [Nitrospirota bacterium]